MMIEYSLCLLQTLVFILAVIMHPQNFSIGGQKVRTILSIVFVVVISLYIIITFLSSFLEIGANWMADRRRAKISPLENNKNAKKDNLKVAGEKNEINEGKKIEDPFDKDLKIMPRDQKKKDSLLTANSKHKKFKRKQNKRKVTPSERNNFIFASALGDEPYRRRRDRNNSIDRAQDPKKPEDYMIPISALPLLRDFFQPRQPSQIPSSQAAPNLTINPLTNLTNPSQNPMHSLTTNPTPSLTNPTPTFTTPPNFTSPTTQQQIQQPQITPQKAHQIAQIEPPPAPLFQPEYEAFHHRGMNYEQFCNYRKQILAKQTER